MSECVTQTARDHTQLKLNFAVRIKYLENLGKSMLSLEANNAAGGCVPDECEKKRPPRHTLSLSL